MAGARRGEKARGEGNDKGQSLRLEQEVKQNQKSRREKKKRCLRAREKRTVQWMREVVATDEVAAKKRTR